MQKTLEALENTRGIFSSNQIRDHLQNPRHQCSLVLKKLYYLTLVYLVTSSASSVKENRAIDPQTTRT